MYRRSLDTVELSLILRIHWFRAGDIFGRLKKYAEFWKIFKSAHEKMNTAGSWQLFLK